MMEIKDLTQNVYEYLKNQGLEVDKVSEKNLRLPRKFDVDSCFFSTFNGSMPRSALFLWRSSLVPTRTGQGRWILKPGEYRVPIEVKYHTMKKRGTYKILRL